MDEFENKNVNENTAQNESADNVTQEAETRPPVEPISGVSYYIPEKEANGNGNTLATVSMILGIISAATVLLCCCCGYYWITVGLGIAAIICGIIARNKGTEKKGKWLAGIICGAVGIGCAILLLIFSVISSATDGMFIINMLAPVFEAAGVNMDEMQTLIDSGATTEEIMEWLEEQLESIEGSAYGAKAMIQALPATIHGIFGR